MFGKTKTGGQSASFLRKTSTANQTAIRHGLTPALVPAAPGTAAAPIAIASSSSSAAANVASATIRPTPTLVPPTTAAAAATAPNATAKRTPPAAAAASSSSSAAAASAAPASSSIVRYSVCLPAPGSSYAVNRYHIAKFLSRPPPFPRTTKIEAPTQIVKQKPRGRMPIDKKKGTARQAEEMAASVAALAPSTKWHIRNDKPPIHFTGEPETGAVARPPAAGGSSDSGKNSYLLLIPDNTAGMMAVPIDFFAFRPAPSHRTMTAEEAEVNLKKRASLGTKWANRKGMLTGEEKRMKSEHTISITNLQTLDGGDSGNDPSVGDDAAATLLKSGTASGGGDDGGDDVAEDLVAVKKEKKKKSKDGDEEGKKSDGMDFRDNFSDDDEDTAHLPEDSELKTEGAPLEEDAEDLHEVEKGAEAELKAQEIVSDSAKRLVSQMDGKKPKEKPADDMPPLDDDDDDDSEEEEPSEEEKKKKEAAEKKAKDAAAAAALELDDAEAKQAEADADAAAEIEGSDSDSGEDDVDDAQLDNAFNDDDDDAAASGKKAKRKAASDDTEPANIVRTDDKPTSAAAFAAAGITAKPASAAAASSAAAAASTWTVDDVKAQFTKFGPMTGQQLAIRLKDKVRPDEMPQLINILKTICNRTAGGVLSLK